MIKSKKEVKDKKIHKLARKDLIHIEFMRIIAIYLVLFNHTGKKGYALFTIAKESPMYWVYLFISILDKIAVPLFFMISGALLLGKDEKISDVYRKRIFKFVIVLITASLCYEIYYVYFENLQIGFVEMLVKIYSKNTSVALWYLYAYIGFLVMLPLLRKLANAMSDKEYIYLFLCHLVIVGIIPTVEYVMSRGRVCLNPKFSTALFTQWNTFYVLIGYYIEKKLDKKYFNKRNVYIGLVASFIAISISCFIIYITGIDKESNFVIHNNLISVPTITAYFTIKYMFEKVKVSSFKANLIRFVGGTTFGIYLMEEMLRDRTVFIFNYLKPTLHTLPATIIWIAFACIVGCIVVSVLKKIPIVRDYL